MAEMTAAEALEVLGGSEKKPQSEQELITSIIAGMTRGEKCFVLLWDSERVQIAALIEQQAQTIEAINNLLSDNYSESKDWRAGNSIERILWLKAMFENKKVEIAQFEQTIEAQARDIETLTQANAEMVLRLTIGAMRNLTSEQIDEVCRRIIAGQVKEGQ